MKGTLINQGEEKKGRHAPASLRQIYGTSVAEYMLKQDAGRFMLGKYLSNKKIHGSEGDDWGWRWQENPTASFLTKKGKMQSAGCRLCRTAREARGNSTDSLSAETRGHIDSGWFLTRLVRNLSQRQLRLPTTQSEGTCMTACTLHKSQKESSSLSCLTK